MFGTKPKLFVHVTKPTHSVYQAIRVIVLQKHGTRVPSVLTPEDEE